MSLHGHLEDVPIIDVLQFIHLGRRSGTLYLKHHRQEANIGFHRGRIVSAWTTKSTRLGDLLVIEGAITPHQLQESLAKQEVENPRRSLGQILISNQIVEADLVFQAVEQQIQNAVFQLVNWKAGEFRFMLDDIEPVDDIGLYPEDIIPNLGIDTQVLMLEAVRLHDERNKEEEEFEAAEPTEISASPFAKHDASATGTVAAASSTQRPTQPQSDTMALWPILQVVTKDRLLFQDLARNIQTDPARIMRVSPRDAGSPPAGEEPPIVIMDVREGQVPMQAIQWVKRARPRVSIIAVIDAEDSLPDAYAAGALNVLPADHAMLASAVSSLAEHRVALSPGNAIESGIKQGFAKLRRVLSDMRTGFMSANMALNLMHTIADSVERSVLFLVRGEELVALGAFGVSSVGKPLAAETRGLSFAMQNTDAFRRTLNAGKASEFQYEDLQIPAAMDKIIGRPKSGQTMIFPVMGSRRAIAVIYIDNGRSQGGIGDVQVLELAAAQMGYAFENELLRHKLNRKRQAKTSIEVLSEDENTGGSR